MRGPERWLIRDVSLADVDARLDVRLAEGRIVELGSDLSSAPGERALLGRGGALLPGLSDHHVHLWATAAAAGSVDLAGGHDLALARAAADSLGLAGAAWLRVIGVGAELSRADLDQVFAERPVRAQHRSGALWTLNSAAVSALAAGLSVEERRTGQLWRADSRLRTLLDAAGSAGDAGAVGAESSVAAELSRLGARLASWGVTHLTDASPETDEASLAALEEALPQHVLSLSAIGAGPRKVVVTDHRLPDLDELTAALAAEHLRGRPVAIHAVSAVGLGLAVAALEQAGVLAGDRIEHAAVCDDSAARRLAELGLIVVTQPGVFARHGARFIADSPLGERESLWRYGGLLRAGVRVVISSDAPYGELNPWSNIAAAERRAGPESVSAGAALASLLTAPADPAGSRRPLTVGAPADLCLLRASLAETLAELNALSGSTPVAATFVGGSSVYQAAELPFGRP